MARGRGELTSPLATLSWRTDKFGGMRLEGAGRLAYKAELESIADPAARQARYLSLVDQLYQRGKALNIATVHEVDDVIDPSETRAIVSALFATSSGELRSGERGFIDSW